MDRRQALYQTSLLLGGAIVGAEAILSGCSNKAAKESNTLFQTGDEALLDAIAETILPSTADSPGAKAAKSGAFMMLIVQDCYEKAEQTTFIAGLKNIEQESQTEFKNGFIGLKPEQQFQLLSTLDAKATAHEKNKSEDEPVNAFTLIKQLATFAYFSSEVGTTQALRYNPIPGRFEGCVDYQKGEKAWA